MCTGARASAQPAQVRALQPGACVLGERGADRPARAGGRCPPPRAAVGLLAREALGVEAVDDDRVEVQADRVASRPPSSIVSLTGISSGSATAM